MKTRFILLLLLLPQIARSQAPPVNDQLLDRMTGQWLLKGTIDGKATVHIVSVNWVLGHQYIQFKEVSQEKNSDGSPVYDALVYITWEQSLNKYSCLWLDNTGNSGLSNGIIGHAERNTDRIEFIFHYSAGSAFHTSFFYDSNKDSWHMTMLSESNGKEESFADAVMTKEGKKK